MEIVKGHMYRNLNKGAFSIKTQQDDGKYKVTHYASEGIMYDCTFRESETMQYKIKNKCNFVTRNGVTKHDGRNVHAWVKFEAFEITEVDVEGLREITYNPMIDSRFRFVDTNEVVEEVEVMYFKNNKIYLYA